ncbi:hypothetical protein KXX58_000582 [Aspergillus fumigatus]|nr:hypothetical protein KXX38_006841 [Aspergillus fumigatus]KAH1469506.1 hypothetical protein KXX58_000582 [Aspergillus fumigatus]KAH2058629.1 hypothetical protein KXW51_003199 [Aspergillus fumigatus]KAH2808967.1 hypothetical protein KXV23_007375 [Aspergillus fumigatus]KAH3195011.1 hypothetical protein KXX02_005281 [Aspergillus fumigatus]
MPPPVPSRAFFREVSTKHGPYIVSCLPTKSQRLPKIPNWTLPPSSTCSRVLGPRLHRQYTTASAQSQTAKPYQLLRRIVGFTAIAIVAFSTGLAYQTQKTVSRMMAASMPTDEETLAAFVPSDELSKEVEEYIRNHPVTLALRQNPAYTESRPHMKIPQELRARHLTAGILATPGGIVVPPYVFCEEGGKSLTAIFYLGSDVSGHPGIVHGGLLATLLDESMARCCFPALPNKVGVTANLNIDYRRPAMANNYAVLKAKTVKVEGRKAWVEAHIETLPEDGKEPVILVEAKALFVEPKQAAAMAILPASRPDIMSKSNKYLLVSLPTSITPSHHRDDALDAVSATVSPDNGSVAPFPIPEFKIGTLDALVQQADELAKLEASCQGVVAKVGDALKGVLEGDETQIDKMKTVNDKPVDQYLRTFSWNKVKYRADKPLGELIDLLQKEAASIDNDIRSKYSQYNQVKNTLATLQRKQTGNLSTKSLASVVDPRTLVRDSEYIETHLVAVPAQQVKEFLKTYETVAPMVVPRSATLVASDDEFTLYAVTTFKKHSPEFVHRCREHKWIPRDFKYVEGGKEEEQKEVERVGGDERKLWGETLRLGRTAWSEAVMVWIHVLVLRVFVETVLRYGLPLDFVCTIIRTQSSKYADRAKRNLDEKYSYLAGNAFGRDKKGRVKRDDPHEMQAGAEGGGAEYTAYVYYEFEFN